MAESKQWSLVKEKKMNFLYSYPIGTQFKQRAEAIAESLKTIHEDLEKEKRTLQKNWVALERQITRVLMFTVGVYGNIYGITGTNLLKIESLEFDSPKNYEIVNSTL